jgi:hypothetical protein
MCMFVVFARKDGASRLIYIPKRTPTRFIPPLCFLLACVFRCCLGQGESKIPPSNPHKDHAWHSTLICIIQCLPYIVCRVGHSSVLMPCAVVCSRGHISEPPLDSPPHPSYPLTPPPPAHMSCQSVFLQQCGPDVWNERMDRQSTIQRGIDGIFEGSNQLLGLESQG